MTPFYKAFVEANELNGELTEASRKQHIEFMQSTIEAAGIDDVYVETLDDDGDYIVHCITFHAAHKDLKKLGAVADALSDIYGYPITFELFKQYKTVVCRSLRTAEAT